MSMSMSMPTLIEMLMNTAGIDQVPESNCARVKHGRVSITARGESRRQGKQQEYHYSAGENTLQDIRRRSIEERTLQYVSVPENCRQ
jgi:hypothetical protein